MATAPGQGCKAALLLLGSLVMSTAVGSRRPHEIVLIAAQLKEADRLERVAGAIDSAVSVQRSNASTSDYLTDITIKVGERLDTATPQLTDQKDMPRTTSVIAQSIDPIRSRPTLQPHSEQCVSMAIFNGCINYVIRYNWTVAAYTAYPTISHLRPAWGTVLFFMLLIIVGSFELALGEWQLKASFMLLVATTTFLFALYVLIHVMMLAEDAEDTTFVVCGLPLVLAITFSAIITVVAALLVRSRIGEKTAYFVFGASAGVLLTFQVRSFIVLLNPTIATNEFFNFYWMVIFGCGLICGLVGICVRTAPVVATSVSMGAYLMAISAMALLQLHVPGGVNGWYFFGIFGLQVALGLIIQLCFIRPARLSAMRQGNTNGGHDANGGHGANCSAKGNPGES